MIVIDSRSAALMDRNGFFLPLFENFRGWVIEGMSVGEIGKRTVEIAKLNMLKEIEQWYNYYGLANLFKIDSVSMKDLDRIELRSGEQIIYIHTEQIQAKLEMAKKVLSAAKKNNIQFEYLDLRFNDPYLKEKGKENG